MLPIRKTLFEQLYFTFNKQVLKNFSLKNNSLKAKKLITELMDANDSSEMADKTETLSFIKLERRIDTLEKQNDQLIYFIDFLIEQLPDLINNIIIKRSHFLEFDKSESEANCSKTEHLQQLLCSKNNNSPNPTRREAEVLELLNKGFCAKEIANKLFISETTVVTHKKNLKEKFNARNTVELISKAHTSLSKNEK
jgi:DNA-binding CsgD family transcriptional regulator